MTLQKQTRPVEYATVKPEWIDLYGHMNMAYYVLILDELGHRILEGFGLGETYTRRENRGLFTVEANLKYQREVKAGDRLRVELTVLGHDAKRLRTRVELFNLEQDYLSATMEQTAVNVDLDSRRVVPFSAATLQALKSLSASLGSLRG